MDEPNPEIRFENYMNIFDEYLETEKKSLNLINPVNFVHNFLGMILDEFSSNRYLKYHKNLHKNALKISKLVEKKSHKNPRS